MKLFLTLFFPKAEYFILVLPHFLHRRCAQKEKMMLERTRGRQGELGRAALPDTWAHQSAQRTHFEDVDKLLILLQYDQKFLKL